jgi:hypothetical protein
VTFRLDIFTRDIASFRNDFSHFIERGGHQACSLVNRNERRPQPGASKPANSGPSIVNAPYSEGCREVQRRAPGFKPPSRGRQKRRFGLASKSLSLSAGSAGIVVTLDRPSHIT